jgi:CheY-like chemotaxis protein
VSPTIFQNAVRSEASLISLSILIVEDVRDAADMLAAVLELLGHRVFCAQDGAAAVEMARSIRPDVLLCDIGLPGDIDGYEVARSIRREPQLRSTRLIALTGWARETDRLRALGAGFDRHVTKPVDLVDLVLLLGASASPG